MDGGYRQKLWIEKATEISYISRIDQKYTTNLLGGYGPYILVLVVTFVDIGLLPLIGYFQTGAFITLVNPVEFLIPPVYVLVVWFIFRLYDRYQTTVQTIETLPRSNAMNDDEKTTAYQQRNPIIRRLFPNQGSQEFSTFFPQRQKFLILLFGWAFHIGWFVVNPTAGDFVVGTAGPLVATAKFGLIYPFVYYPIGVEFLTVFLAIHILLPYKITQAQFIDFEDLQGYGGLRPVGRLSKTSALHYLFLLSLYAGYISLSRGVSTFDPSQIAFIVGGMLVGFTLFFLPILWLGLYMQAQKHAKINQIAQDIKEQGEDNSTFPETRAASLDDASIYTHEFTRLAVVKDMKDYPVDIFTIRDFLYALPVPILVNIFTSYLTKNLLPL